MILLKDRVKNMDKYKLVYTVYNNIIFLHICMLNSQFNMYIISNFFRSLGVL